MPKIAKRKPSARAREKLDAQRLHDAALTHFAECGGFKGRRQPKRISKAIIAKAARVAYNRWVKEAGFEHDARISEWEKLEEVHRERWGCVARAIIETADEARQQEGGKA